MIHEWAQAPLSFVTCSLAELQVLQRHVQPINQFQAELHWHLPRHQVHYNNTYAVQHLDNEGLARTGPIKCLAFVRMSGWR